MRPVVLLLALVGAGPLLAQSAPEPADRAGSEANVQAPPDRPLGLLHDMAGRDFMVCMPLRDDPCPEASRLAAAVRTQPDGSILVDFSNTYDSLQFSVAEGQPAAKVKWAGGRKLEASEDLVRIKLIGGSYEITREGHDFRIVQKYLVGARDTFLLTSPDAGDPKVAKKIAKLAEKHGPATSRSASTSVATAAVQSAAPAAMAGTNGAAGAAGFGYLEKLVGRDFVLCSKADPTLCNPKTSHPMLVRRGEDGIVFGHAEYATRFLPQEDGTIKVRHDGYRRENAGTAHENEFVLDLGKNERGIYTEYSGRPALLFFSKDKLQSVSYFHDASSFEGKLNDKFAKLHRTHGQPIESGPFVPSGITGPTSQRLLEAGGFRKIELALAEEKSERARRAAAQNRQASSSPGKQSNGGNGREIRKTLGGILGGVVGMVGGLSATDLASGSDALVGIAAGVAGALVGSGEVSPEDALAATSAVAGGVAQGYAEAAERNARSAAVMAEARAADEHYRQQKLATAQAAADAKAQADRETIARVLGEAEAIRAAEMQRATASGNTARQQQLAQQSAAAMETARQLGIEKQVRDGARKIAAADGAAIPQQSVQTASRPQPTVQDRPRALPAAQARKQQEAAAEQSEAQRRAAEERRLADQRKAEPQAERAGARITRRAYLYVGMNPGPRNTRNPMCYSTVFSVTFDTAPKGWGDSGRARTEAEKHKDSFRAKCANRGSVDSSSSVISVVDVNLSDWSPPRPHSEDVVVQIP